MRADALAVDRGLHERRRRSAITSLFAAAALALAAWFAIHLLLLGLWRPPRGTVGPTPSLTDESLLRVLRAVARDGSGNGLRTEILTAALSGLVRLGRVELDDRGVDGVWVAPGERAIDDALAPHELALLDRIRLAAVRTGSPVPLDALRLAETDDDAVWLRRSAAAAIAWARSVGLVRDHLPVPARVLLRVLLAVPVGLVAVYVVDSHDLRDAVELVLAGAGAALAWWGLGRMLVAPMAAAVLTEAGRAVLASVPSPREEVPAWVLSVLATPAGRQPAWTAGGRGWRLVDVDRTPVRGGGDRPGVALYAAFLRGVLLLVAGIFLAVVTVTLLTAARSRLVDLGFAAAWVAWLYGTGRMVRTVARAAADVREGPEHCVGHVVERRRVAYGDDPERYYLAVDDGSGSVSTFLVSREQFGRAPEGGWIRISITPRLGHVADVELLTPAPQAGAVADLTLTLRRRRRSRTRSARA